jgi:hypothetical protein
MGRADPGRLPPLDRKFALARKGEGERTAVHHSDVIQNQHGDCFLMAAMAAVVQQHPAPDRWLEKVIKDNGDGSYTVTFQERVGLPFDPETLRPTEPRFASRVVTVTDLLPGGATSDDKGEKWPAVLEAAYAKAYGGDGPKPFENRDRLGDAMEQLTGVPSTMIDASAVTIDQLEKYLAGHHAVTVLTFPRPTSGLPHEVSGSHPLYESGGLAPTNADSTPATTKPVHEENSELKPLHEYYVNRVDRAAGTVIVHNVWDEGREDIAIPIADFQTAMQSVRVNPIYPR